MKPIYLEENTFVLDASVVMPWAFEDENDPYALSVLSAMKNHTAIIPPLWMLEVTNVLLTAIRRNRIEETKAMEFLAQLDRMLILTAPSRSKAEMPNLLRLAKNFNLTSYDAEYLSLAVERGLPLSTSDAHLLVAMQATNVSRFSP
jgi:predicted nucleic acid-binding protein